MKLEPVRLVELSISGLKNVHNGSFRMPEDQVGQASMLGIYGQNGSGKTAVINALEILKLLMSGQVLPQSMAGLVTEGLGMASIRAEFTFRGKKIAYSAELLLTEAEKVTIKTETLSCGRKSLRFLAGQKDFVLPKEIRTYARGKKCDDDLKAYSILTTKECRSFLFSNEFRGILQTVNQKNATEWFELIIRLLYYSVCELFIIVGKMVGFINLGILLSISYKSDNEFYNIPINLNTPTLLNLDQFAKLEKALIFINELLTSIVPKLSISIQKHGQILLKDNTPAMSFDLMSNVDGKTIPFRYESEGIQKIFSILGLLAAAYKDESVLIAVDEFDAGIFEYMLGEIIEVFHKYGRGQFIFTSHNLRPLEKLHHSAVVFTTTNKDNRYINLSNVKPSNNLRDVYLRSIFLGGQNEELYEETSTNKIRRAFESFGGYPNEDKC